MNCRLCGIWILTACLILYKPAVHAAPTPTTGTLSGRVVFQGTPPPSKVVVVTQDREICGETMEMATIEVIDGGLKNALVKLNEAEGDPAAAFFPDPVLDQKGCLFLPHILLMAPGELTIKNSDGIMHNVHFYPRANPQINLVMPGFRRQTTVQLDHPETIRIRCDAHAWMSAYIIVAKNPFYALTDATGQFEIRNIPQGNHTVEVWHETLGVQHLNVTIEAGKTARIEPVYQQGE